MNVWLKLWIQTILKFAPFWDIALLPLQTKAFFSSFLVSKALYCWLLVFQPNTGTPSLSHKSKLVSINVHVIGKLRHIFYVFMKLYKLLKCPFSTIKMTHKLIQSTVNWWAGIKDQYQLSMKEHTCGVQIQSRKEQGFETSLSYRASSRPAELPKTLYLKAWHTNTHNQL